MLPGLPEKDIDPDTSTQPPALQPLVRQPLVRQPLARKSVLQSESPFHILPEQSNIVYLQSNSFECNHL